MFRRSSAAVWVSTETGFPVLVVPWRSARSGYYPCIRRCRASPPTRSRVREYARTSRLLPCRVQDEGLACRRAPSHFRRWDRPTVRLEPGFDRNDRVVLNRRLDNLSPEFDCVQFGRVCRRPAQSRPASTNDERRSRRIESNCHTPAASEAIAEADPESANI
jgi:hypothetical protein